ncbi:hypothetical protein AB0O00_40385, partial [Kitasatospora sp. NPDC093558]
MGCDQPPRARPRPASTPGPPEPARREPATPGAEAADLAAATRDPRHRIQALRLLKAARDPAPRHP